MATLTSLLPLAGCYSYAPAVDRGRLVPATAVALRISDAGRVALASRFGDGVRTIEGKLQQAPDSVVRMSVTAVQYLDGRVQPWAGESVVISNGDIGVLETRSRSKTRTILIVGASVAALVLFIASRSLNVFGGGSTDTPSGGGQQQS
jgi:hypothetical protein